MPAKKTTLKGTSQKRKITRRLTRERRREQLLEIASQLFAETNFSNVTTALLAKHAGITEPVLYQHFATKDILYQEVLRWGGNKILREWETLEIQNNSALQSLTKILQAQLKRDDKLWLYFKLQLQALADSSDPQIRIILKQNYQHYHGFLEKLLKQAQSQKTISSELQADQLAWFMLSQGFMINAAQQIELDHIIDSNYLKNTMEIFLSESQNHFPNTPTHNHNKNNPSKVEQEES